MRKLLGFWRVLRLGESVANPARWKKGQVTVNAIAAFLFAFGELSKAFGYELPASPEQIGGLSVGILALGNILLTVTTSEKIGLPAEHSSVDDTGDGNSAPVRWGED